MTAIASYQAFEQRLTQTSTDKKKKAVSVLVGVEVSCRRACRAASEVFLFLRRSAISSEIQSITLRVDVAFRTEHLPDNKLCSSARK